jgi:hypothetical protein
LLFPVSPPLATLSLHRSGCELLTWARPIVESGSSSWPTAGASDHKGSSKPGQRARQLSEVVEQTWPTPTTTSHRPSHESEDQKARLQREAEVWATPQAHDAKAPRADQDPRVKSPANLNDNVKEFSLSSPQDPHTPLGPPSSSATPNSLPRLNPLFANWLMALPVGWSSVSTSFGPVEIASYRARLRSLLRTCGISLNCKKDCTSE